MAALSANARTQLLQIAKVLRRVAKDGYVAGRDDSELIDLAASLEALHRLQSRYAVKKLRGTKAKPI
jgi:hypothetical protein